MDFQFSCGGTSGTGAPTYLYVREEQPSGTAGGMAQGDTEYQRTLNTVVVNDISGASLTANNITLPPGTYYVHAVAPATKASNQSRIVSVSGDAVTLTGPQSGSFIPTGAGSPAFGGTTVRGNFTLTSETTIKLVTRHGTVGGTPNASDLGAASFKYLEIYSEVEIWKLA